MGNKQSTPTTQTPPIEESIVTTTTPQQIHLTQEQVNAFITNEAQSSVKQYLQRYNQQQRTMAAIIYSKYGEPTVMDLKSDVPIPELDDRNRVLIQVHYASVNPVDYKIRSGYLRMFYKVLFPMIPGQDASGIVVKSNIDKFKEGDRVFGYLENGRTFAEYAACKENELAHMPSELSMAEAATLPTVGLATYYSLVKVAGLPVALNNITTDQEKTINKKKVLIIGASGGVGSFAVQYAKKVLNAEVYATCSSRNSTYVKDLGADHVYEYDTDPNYQKLIPQVDVIMDNVGGDDIRKKTWGLLKARRGAYLQVGAVNQEMKYSQASFTGALLVWRKVTSTLRLSPSFHVIATKSDGTALEEVTDHYLKAHVTPGYITRNYTLSENNARLAHRLLESGRTRGKIIVQISDHLGQGETYLNTLFLAKFNTKPQ
jgi:alcohol dehydrogenase